MSVALHLALLFALPILAIGLSVALVAFMVCGLGRFAAALARFSDKTRGGQEARSWGKRGVDRPSRLIARAGQRLKPA